MRFLYGYLIYLFAAETHTHTHTFTFAYSHTHTYTLTTVGCVYNIDYTQPSKLIFLSHRGVSSYFLPTGTKQNKTK